MVKKRIFLKHRPMLLGMAGLRILLFFACVSLIGTRIFVGGRVDEDVINLFNATKLGSVDRIKTLLLKGVNPDALDLEKNTPIFFNGLHSFFFGEQYLTAMRLLLSFYANINHHNVRGESVFQASVTNIDGTILKNIFLTLFSYGGNLDLKDNQGHTFLTVITMVNTKTATDQLLAIFADIFGFDRISKVKELAISYGYTDIAKIFDVYLKQLETNTFVPPKNRGVNEFVVRIRKQTGRDYTFVQQEKTQVIKARDMFGNNLLHFAMMTGNTDLAESLFKHTPELISVKNNAGSYPIHFLARSDVPIEHRKDMLQLCKKYHVNLNSTDGTGATLLMLLLRKKDVAYITYLLSECGDLVDRHIRDKNGESPREFLERKDKELLPILATKTHTK